MNASGWPAGMRPARSAAGLSHGEPRVRMRRGPSTGEWTSWLGSSCRQVMVPSVPDTCSRRSFSSPAATCDATMKPRAPLS